MTLWQTLLINANACFNQQNFEKAEENYHQAIECIEQYWQENSNDFELLMAWVSAFHNLAVLYETQEQPKLAFRYLQIPHQRMTELSQQSQYGDSLNFFALRALKITLTPMLAFSKKYPACDGCLSSLQKMAVVINDNQPVIH